MELHRQGQKTFGPHEARPCAGRGAAVNRNENQENTWLVIGIAIPVPAFMLIPSWYAARAGKINGPLLALAKLQLKLFVPFSHEAQKAWEHISGLDPAALTWERMSAILSYTGKWIRWPFILFLGLFGAAAVFMGRVNILIRRLNMVSLLRHNAESFACLLPVLGRGQYLLSPESYDAGIWRIFGSAEALTQLLVALMPASDGANSIFADKAQALITGVMYALVDLRDKGLIKLSTKVIRESLALEKCVALALRPELDAENRDSIQAALGTSGWIAGREMKDQPPSFAEQYGYAQSYFGKALSSLTDTYSHIYGAEDSEVDFADAIMQRRILVVLLPSLEKAPQELAGLGKISLSAIRNACSVGLGAQIEGDAADVLESLPTDTVGIGPYLCIVDEYAAIVTPGFEVVLTQGRGLGIAAIVAGQDYAGIMEADKKGAQQMVANTVTKKWAQVWQEPHP